MFKIKDRNNNIFWKQVIFGLQDKFIESGLLAKINGEKGSAGYIAASCNSAEGDMLVKNYFKNCMGFYDQFKLKNLEIFSRDFKKSCVLSCFARNLKDYSIAMNDFEQPKEIENNHLLKFYNVNVNINKLLELYPTCIQRILFEFILGHPVEDVTKVKKIYGEDELKLTYKEAFDKCEPDVMIG